MTVSATSPQQGEAPLSGENVAQLLHRMAAERPDQMAIAEPTGRDEDGQHTYREISFRELDEDSSLLAQEFARLGAQRGSRVALLVRPGIDFISLVFALFKAGLVVVMIDPGMGRKSMVRCLSETRPEGFVAISLAHAVRMLLRHKFRDVKWNVTVGRRWFWSGPTLTELRRAERSGIALVAAEHDDPAAIIFTTGSTGPPKGVLYRHGNFTNQARQIQQHYGIAPGEIDLPGFPLFALFNCAMGVSTVFPDMDPTRPADVDPQNILQAVRRWDVTQAFGSPALWNVVGQYCERQQVRMPTLRRVLSAGAPVPPHVLQRMKNAIAQQGDIFTPYGATEALPVASIAASEVLADTAHQTRLGRGTCVGRAFSGISWKVIAIADGPLESIDQVNELPAGEIGELIVQGPVVTTEYVTSTDANQLHKITDGRRFWHRMGDVGYFDEQDRFWFCGRRTHRVVTEQGTLYTVMCEAVFNEHPDVYRSALVGVGEAGQQIPVLIAETWPDKKPASDDATKVLLGELREIAGHHDHTRHIQHFMWHPSLPVDIRHNAKIFREKLAVWAAKRMSGV